LNEVYVWIEAVELLGPGLPNWDAARPVLAGEADYVPSPVELPPPARLSPAERRRAIPSVRLALAVGHAATGRSGRDPAAMPAVFASSGADGETIDTILSALAAPAREVSPTRFHNSVHNAPSGYWSLAANSRQPVTSLAGYDGSFAAGLLEAGVQAVCGGTAVLLVAYDLPYPEPLARLRPIVASFGVALILSPTRTDRALARLALATGCDRSRVDGCDDPGLEALRLDNPAARSLPLLAAVAARRTSSMHLEFGRSGLHVATSPC